MNIESLKIILKESNIESLKIIQEEMNIESLKIILKGSNTESLIESHKACRENKCHDVMNA